MKLPLSKVTPHYLTSQKNVCLVHLVHIQSVWKEIKHNYLEVIFLSLPSVVFMHKLNVNKCKTFSFKALKDVGMEVLKSVETRKHP